MYIFNAYIYIYLLTFNFISLVLSYKANISADNWYAFDSLINL